MASSLETNKLLAAILTAGVIASGSGVVSRILYAPSIPEEPAYQIAVAEGDEAPEAEEEAPIGVLLASATVEEGQTSARACAACHTFEEGGAAGIGPPLWGVLGRDIAGVDGFAYSPALADMEGEWDYENLSAFLADPRGFASGTKMAFAGIRNPEDRADVILFLRSLHDGPPPLPEVEEEAAPAEEAAAEDGGEQTVEGEQEDAAAGGGDFMALIAAADPAAGQSASRPCVACHIFEAEGPRKLGPTLHGVVGREIAGVEGFSYSDALAGKDGEWTYENLNAFLEDPRGWAPGTKMAFSGVKREGQRAEIIAYLRSVTDDPPPLPGDG